MTSTPMIVIGDSRFDITAYKHWTDRQKCYINIAQLNTALRRLENQKRLHVQHCHMMRCDVIGGNGVT